MSPGLFLVLAMTVLGGDGSLLHAEPRLVRLDLRDRSGRLDNGRLRELVETLARLGANALWPWGDRADRDQLDLITAREQARLERLRRREQAIAGASSEGYPSAARQLVQAGLFDRRALRAAALDAASADNLRRDLSERAARASATSSPVSRTELIAALLVPGRP